MPRRARSRNPWTAPRCSTSGATEHALHILRGEGFAVAPLLPWLRAAALAPATVWSAYAGCVILGDGTAARTCFIGGTTLLALAWQFAPHAFTA